MATAVFMLASASIIALFGTLHLVATYRGPKLHPTDAAVKSWMENSRLVLTGQTTMWRAWIGFNASHSLGAILFGLMYSYLALGHPDLLFSSGPLLGIGMVTLIAYGCLAKAYWFSIPFIGICLATACYALAVGLALF